MGRVVSPDPSPIKWDTGRMELRLESGQAYGRVECYVCGELFMCRGVHISAFEDERRLGSVCETCLDAGLDGLRARMRVRAETLRAAAAELDRFQAGSIHLPDMNEVQERQDEAQATFKREIRLGRANARINRDLDGQMGR